MNTPRRVLGRVAAGCAGEADDAGDGRILEDDGGALRSRFPSSRRRTMSSRACAWPDDDGRYPARVRTPLGSRRRGSTVRPISARVTQQRQNRCRRTQIGPSVVHSRACASKPRSSQRLKASVVLVVLSRVRNRAHSIGVERQRHEAGDEDRELIVIGEFVEQRPTTPDMNSERDEHRRPATA